MRALRLKKGEDKRLRHGHLWVFSNEVDVKATPLADFAPGEQVTLLSAQGKELGSAYVNPASLICARLYTRAANTPLDATLLRARLQAALELRERLFPAPFYRLCHGEGDLLPGLVIDRYGSVFAVQMTTAGMDALCGDILQVLVELFAPTCVSLRNDVPSRALEQLPLTREDPVGHAPAELLLPENGVDFAIPFAQGQKTGWFYDQRANRAAAAACAREATVLDAFSYVGGFGVTCASRGARQVDFLDASATALDCCRANLARNAPRCQGVFHKGDALTLLEELRDAGHRYDVVCLDPPAFIKRRKDAATGLAAYRKANDLAADLVREGGVVVSCSCSHLLTAEQLADCVNRAAGRRGLAAQLIRRGGQGPDHPVHGSIPETAYLKCLMARLQRP